MSKDVVDRDIAAIQHVILIMNSRSTDTLMDSNNWHAARTSLEEALIEFKKKEANWWLSNNPLDKEK